MKNKFQGKLRKAEFWLTRFVDKFEEAQNLGVEAAVLDEARGKHYEAHVHWEWWTASNGSHFHNPAPGRGLDQQGHDDLAGRHQAARRRDGQAAHRGAHLDGGTCGPAADGSGIEVAQR